MIKIENLNKYYNKNKSNEIHVINNTNLILPDKGLIALLGESGSGKTTLLNVIGGLDKAKGKITFDDEEFDGYKVSKIDKFRIDNIGYVFQNYNLMQNLSVYDNLRMSLVLSGVSDIDLINDRIDYVLSALSMKKFKYRMASNLSGGQQQRVSIARALVKDCKIIIADEPTGNLDSTNSMEVMNILKKISTTRLVLLVTHNKTLATFYADRIVQIKDGAIDTDNDNTTDADKTLSTKGGNMVYLQDMKSQSFTNEGIKMDFYYDDADKVKDLNLRIVFKDNVFYIESKESNVKMVGINTNVKLLDEQYKDFTKTDLTDFNFDLPKNTNVIRKRKINLKRLWQSFLIALKSLIFSKFRAKLLYFGFMTIGAVMAVLIIILGTYNYVDTSNYQYISGYEKCDNLEYNNFNDYRDKLIDAYKEGYIEDVVLSDYSTISLPSKNASDTLSSFYESTIIVDANNLVSSDFIAGKEATSNSEIVIDKMVADKIIIYYKDSQNLKYTDIVGLEINVSSHNYMVSGVVDTKSTAVYLSNQTYSIESWMNSNADYASEYSYSSGKYTIISGRDVDRLSTDLEVIIPINDWVSYSLNGVYDYYGYDGLQYATVVGFYKSDYYSGPLMNNTSFLSNELASMSYSNLSAVNDEVELVEGALPNDNQILINYLYKSSGGYEIGDEVFGLTISGYFFGKTSELSLIYSTKNTKDLDDLNQSQYFYEIYIKPSNENEFNTYMESFGYNMTDSLQAAINEGHRINKELYSVLISIVGVLIALIVIYVYFMMRSRMINRIYEIGVLRALGATRLIIHKMFIMELFVITTFTTLLGYLTVMGLFYSINAEISKILKIFDVSTLFLWLGIAAIYLLNFIFGLLPIYTLLRKTPSEILSKYDI